MAFVSITRLRLRSPWLVPFLIWRAFWSQRQARAAEGNIATDSRTENGKVFWTRSVWRDEQAMRAFMTSGAHRAAMPKLLDWCDEAAVAHWTQDNNDMPDWETAKVRMRTEGRLSKVRHPSPAHARGETVPEF